MTAEALARSVLALAPPGTVLGQIPAETPLPWRSMSVSLPGNAERSEAASVHGYSLRVSLTVSAGTEFGVLRTADEIVQHLEGSIPVEDGWMCGPLLQAGMGTPYLADMELPGADRLVVLHFSFTFTATRRP